MKKIIIALIILLMCGCSNKEYSKNMFYMDTLINVRLYNIESKKAKNAYIEIENILKKYQSLTDKYDENSELYMINNNYLEIESLKIDPLLYDIIEYSLEWNSKSNGLLNINIGNITDIWKKYRENQSGIPDINELKNQNIDINEIVLKDNRIMNNDLNIDLGAIVKGYATKEIGIYLENEGIDYYLINAGGNVRVGNSNKDYYKVGIASPNSENELISTVKVNNKSIVTSGGYERFYEYDGVKYNHIIDPNTLFPANNMKSVTVIGDDTAMCDALSTILFLMDIESGKEFIKDYDVEVLWYTNNDEIIKSEGFNIYE